MLSMPGDVTVLNAHASDMVTYNACAARVPNREPFQCYLAGSAEVYCAEGLRKKQWRRVTQLFWRQECNVPNLKILIYGSNSSRAEHLWLRDNSWQVFRLE